MNSSADITREAKRYESQGHFWRATSLLQIPLSFILVCYFVNRYLNADTIVDVPDIKGPQDVTDKNKIPDRVYINVGQDIINLIGTFQPTTARDQFDSAREYLLDSALPAFEETQMNIELNTAEQSDISQILFIDSFRIGRLGGGSAQLCASGYRQRIVGMTAKVPPVMPQQSVTYCLTLEPREAFDLNPFGLMVSEFSQKLGPVSRAPMPQRVGPTFAKPTGKDKKKKRKYSK